ncbi:unnamed protein product, partial [Mesorhabditis belari]|uniref:ornithine decarboxylase n=1 Tax=Mesorhabditis belari TaxID=2138241 RepID=A0AAF3FJ73_9BILA
MADLNDESYIQIADEIVLLTDEPREKILKNIAHICDQDQNEGPIMLLDLNVLIEKYDLWKQELPNVEIFYAVKCNSDLVFLSAMKALGGAFDVASKWEMDTVISLDVSQHHILYANPSKSKSALKHAEKLKIDFTTFDSIEELVKIKKYHSHTKQLLRIHACDPTARIPLGRKYGVDEKGAIVLLKHAKEHHLRVDGICFHVGSGCRDFTTFDKAIENARRLFEIGIELGHQMEILDIGGGFWGGKHQESGFRELAHTINRSLERHFTGFNVRVIAEPGRYFAESPITLMCKIFHVREVPAYLIDKEEKDTEKTAVMYYINDGIYGTFQTNLTESERSHGRPLKKNPEAKEALCTVWGPTCSTLDLVEDNVKKPLMESGEWMLYDERGAYTSCLHSGFNGMPPPQYRYTINHQNWQRIKEAFE